jgi:hypothetical protein
MFDKRESDTIRHVALDMDGMTTKNILCALIACYRAGYRHAEDDCNKASLELNGSEATWIEQDDGLVKYEARTSSTRTQKLLETILELLDVSEHSHGANGAV